MSFEGVVRCCQTEEESRALREQIDSFTSLQRSVDEAGDIRKTTSLPDFAEQRNLLCYGRHGISSHKSNRPLVMCD